MTDALCFRSIGIVANPISGDGKSLLVAKRFESALLESGYAVQLLESMHVYRDGVFDSFLSSVDALVICGGDGTVCGLLGLLAQFKVPVYVVPAGVESLFAKRFGMTADVADFLAALARGNVSEQRLVEVQERLFFTVATVGLDSEVVYAISKVRQKAIGRIGYVLPALKAFWQHKVPRLTIEVDDALQVIETRGFFIVANSPRYAGNLSFVPDATSSGDVLRARFYPVTSKLWYFRWLYHFLTQTSFPSANSISLEGTCFLVSAKDSEKLPLQIDGEHCCHLPTTIRRSDKSIRVIC